MPPREYRFWVYILASRSRNLYIGITSNLARRTATHRESTPGTHTARYAIHRLVYYEFFRYVRSALTREKELKHWTRAQKITLIESTNPTWQDLLPPGVETTTPIRFSPPPLPSHFRSRPLLLPLPLPFCLSFPQGICCCFFLCRCSCSCSCPCLSFEKKI